MTTKFKSGAFVFSRARGVEPRRPEDLESLLNKHGLASNIVPDYAGDRAAVGRAFQAAKAGLSKEGLLLRPIQRTQSELVFGVVRETSDAVDQTLEHCFEAVIRWTAEPNPERVDGDHFVANRVDTAYKHLRGMLTADDWSGAISRFLEDHDAARVRSDGRIFWVPPQRVSEVRNLAGFLSEIGIDLVICQIEPEAKAVAQGAAQSSIDEQLTKLQSEVDAFDGTQRPSTYARRLEEFQRLRQRAILYRDALGLGSNRAEVVLADLEAKVTEMLELRENKVPSNSSVEQSTTTKVTTTRIEAIRFAGATFPLVRIEDGASVFGSDDDTAHSKIKLLERIGVAGTWQRLGAASVCIQNSGPPGERVSIRVRTPKNLSIHDCASSLRAIGIEL